MTEFVLKSGRAALAWTGLKWPANGWRLMVLALLTALALSSPKLGGIVFQSISDAYLQVTVFVAGTLALVYMFETAFRFDLGQAMAKARYLQAPIASFLGALPGCGGAIIVVTQYTKGYVSFGSVVAVLVATMGDAAFLLIAREPVTGLGIMALGFTIGTLSGWFIDAVHGADFMRPSQINQTTPKRARPRGDNTLRTTRRVSIVDRIWVYLVIPCGVLGLMVATQVKSDAFFVR